MKKFSLFLSILLCFSLNAQQKKETLTLEYAQQIADGEIGLEGNKYDSLLYGQPVLHPDADADQDGLKNSDEIFIYTKNNKKYIGYISHPRLEDTDGDGIRDSIDTDPLLWDISARDMAMFMELAYRDRNYIVQVLNPENKNLTLYENRQEYQMMHNELAPFWVAKKFYEESSGFDAVLFEFNSPYHFLKNKGVEVFAIRGTKGGKDIGSDISLTFGAKPKQLDDALNVLEEFKLERRRLKKKSKLYFTGHSLGGYLAQAMAAQAAIDLSPKVERAYTFNAPKIKAFPWAAKSFKAIRDKSDEMSYSRESTHYATDNDGVTNSVGRFPRYISVGKTQGGHSSRSYFEKSVGDHPDFRVGKRNTMHQNGYTDPTWADFAYKTLLKDNYNIATTIITKRLGEEITFSDISSSVKVSPEATNYRLEYDLNDTPKPSLTEPFTPNDFVVKVIFSDGSHKKVAIPIQYELNKDILLPFEQEINLLITESYQIPTKNVLPEVVEFFNQKRQELQQKLAVIKSVLENNEVLPEFNTQQKINNLANETTEQIDDFKQKALQILYAPNPDDVFENSQTFSGSVTPQTNAVIIFKGARVIARISVQGETFTGNVAPTKLKAGDELYFTAEFIHNGNTLLSHSAQRVVKEVPKPENEEVTEEEKQNENNSADDNSSQENGNENVAEEEEKQDENNSADDNSSQENENVTEKKQDENNSTDDNSSQENGNETEEKTEDENNSADDDSSQENGNETEEEKQDENNSADDDSSQENENVTEEEKTKDENNSADDDSSQENENETEEKQDENNSADDNSSQENGNETEEKQDENNSADDDSSQKNENETEEEKTEDKNNSADDDSSQENENVTEEEKQDENNSTDDDSSQKNENETEEEKQDENNSADDNSSQENENVTEEEKQDENNSADDDSSQENENVTEEKQDENNSADDDSSQENENENVAEKPADNENPVTPTPPVNEPETENPAEDEEGNSINEQPTKPENHRPKPKGCELSFNNGLNIGERFIIENVNSPCIKQKRFKVYTENGYLVYLMPNYNNHERAFRGYGNQGMARGRQLSAGTYFYIFTYYGKNGRQVKRGWIYIH